MGLQFVLYSHHLELLYQVASTGIEFRFNCALTYQRLRNGFTNPNKFDIQMILCFWIIASGIELCYHVDRVVLPLDMVDNSTGPCEGILSWMFVIEQSG
jgi:hypothetical protein